MAAVVKWPDRTRSMARRIRKTLWLGHMREDTLSSAEGDAWCRRHRIAGRGGFKTAGSWAAYLPPLTTSVRWTLGRTAR